MLRIYEATPYKISISLMKQWLDVTHRYSFTGDRENKTWQILKRPTFKYIMFLRKYKEKQFSWMQDFDRCVCNQTV
jgi:hypothetical protein